MSARLQSIIQSLFKEAPRSKEKSGEDAETEDDTKPPLSSDLEKIVYAVKQWDPFPLRAYDVDDVNEVNKHVLLAIISFVLCTSFALVWISMFIINARRSYEYASMDSFSLHILSFSAIILVISLVSFVFTLCGFVGVFRENIILIRIFYVALIMLLSLKLSIALFTFSFTGTAEHIVGSALGDKLISNYRASTDIEATMDYLQVKFRCCGLREQGFKDWNRSMYFYCSDHNPSTERCGVPWSCCRNETGLSNALCGRNVQKVDRNLASRAIYTKGCIIAILEWAKSHAFLVAFLLLLETSLLTVLIFQSTHLVNELQMMNGVYRGPWWIWIGGPRPDERSTFLQRVEYRDERLVAALPFHLELAWHEAPTAVDQRTPAVSQQGASPSDPQAGAWQQQRRSTAGQRFFRAVVSRASRMANRRQAMSAEEERRRGSATTSAAVLQGQPGTADSDWGVHQRASDAGSVGPAIALSHALDAVGKESEMEPAEVNMPQKPPLPPIGEHTSLRSTSPEVQRSTEVQPAEEMTQSDDRNPSKERMMSFLKQKLSESPSTASSAIVVKQTHSPSDLEKEQTQLPVLIASHIQMSIPNIHTQQGSSEQRFKKVAGFSEERLSDRVSSAQEARGSDAKLEQPALSRLTANAPPSSALTVKKSDFKSPTSSRIALVLDAVERDEEHEASSPPTSAVPDDAVRVPLGTLESASVRQVVSGPTPTAETGHHPAAAASAELTSAAVAVSQRGPSVSVTLAVPPATATSPLQPSTALAKDDSPHRTVSIAKPDVEDDDDAAYQGVDDYISQAGPLPGEKLSAGQESGPMAGPATDQHQQRNVSDASTGTHSGRKGKKDHHRRSKLHRKNKKKGHVGPTEEGASIGEHGAENEPIHEWLKPNRPKTCDVQEASEDTSSAYFSPSEFQHLALRQSPNAAADNASGPRSQRRGSVAAAISKKMRDIFPSFGLHPGGSSKPKLSTSMTPWPSTSRGPGTPGPVGPAAPPLPPWEAESDSEHEG